MKYKTAFRLALRAIGVLVICQNLPWISRYVFANALSASGFTGSSGTLEHEAATLLAGAVCLAMGLYLFFAGEWIVNKAIPSNRPYCQECGYELTGLTLQGNCPECGTAFVRADRIDPDAPV